MEARNCSEETIVNIKNPTPSLCLFCQPINISIKGSPNCSPTFTNRSKKDRPTQKVLVEGMNNIWNNGK